MSDRATDEYGRALYTASEVPPVDCGFAVWRGLITMPDPPAPSNTTTMHRRDGRDTCTGGWVPSGEWWLHCGFCRPYRRFRLIVILVSSSPGAEQPEEQ